MELTPYVEEAVNNHLQGKKGSKQAQHQSKMPTTS
jgi:hypothetical protein